MIVGLIIGILSLFLPWSIATIYTEADRTFILHQLAMNAFDFMTASQPLVLISASLFIAGLLFSILNRWSVVLQLAGMAGLSLTMYSYVSSALTSNVGPPTGSEFEATGFSLGYLLGWFSILILGTLLIGEERRERERPASKSKQPQPSESVELGVSGIFLERLRGRW